MKTQIPITEAIRNRLKILRLAKDCVSCDPLGISYGQWEVLKLEFADEVIAEIERSDNRRARLEALPPREPAAVIEVSLRPKRRRA